MVIFTLAYQSLRNRRFTSALTLCSIALSVALLVGVEQMRVGAREGFANTISQTDLIVGARGGALQLLLYTVFRIGAATNNIAYESYQHFRQHPAVAWTIPYALGDSHHGFRVVGTTEEFYTHYRYHHQRRIVLAAGRIPSEVFDVALGADVATALRYRLGDRIVITHGIAHGRGILEHDDTPFQVVGILEKTATPVDRSLYITLEGMEAMHLDWSDGAPPLASEVTPPERLAKEAIEIKQITAFLLRARSRIETLRLQREVNTYAAEPLMAIIPGVVLSELWRTIGYAEDVLRVISVFVIVVGLLGMLVSLYTALAERRREMAVLRAIGAGPWRIIALLVLESGFLSIGGVILGVALVYGLALGSQPLIERHFGIFIPIQPLTQTAYVYLLSVLGAGLLIGFIPALKAYRNSLVDGLTVRL
jgi:putative ABC transport system permease protein